MLKTLKSFFAKRKKAKVLVFITEVLDCKFDEVIWAATIKYAKDRGFTKPLSLAVLYESILSHDKIPDNVIKIIGHEPIYDEKAWVRRYILVRHSWLKNALNKKVRFNVIYTRAFAKEVNADNWNLKKRLDKKS